MFESSLNVNKSDKKKKKKCSLEEVTNAGRDLCTSFVQNILILHSAPFQFVVFVLSAEQHTLGEIYSFR